MKRYPPPVRGNLGQGAVEGLDRRGEVERPRCRVGEVDQPVAHAAIDGVHGTQPLTERLLRLAERHEVEPDGAVVEGVRRGTAGDLVPLGLAVIAGGAAL